MLPLPLREISYKGVESMNIVITARKTTVKDSFKERIEKKLAKFDRFFDDATANVVVTNERDRETVEITIQAMGMFFRAEKTTADRVDSLESVTDSLMKQIIRNKAKLQKRFRPAAFEEPIPEEPLYEEEDVNVVKVKRFPVKPMTEEEAILQMNLLGHSFFVYRNSEDESLCIVYQRKNGGYGPIVTDEEK